MINGFYIIKLICGYHKNKDRDILKIYVMNNMVKRIVLIMLLFSLVNCENANDEFLIKEGYGVGSFKLGTKMNELSKETKGVKLMVNRDSLIHAIDIVSNKYHTKDNSRVGVNYETILKQKGNTMRQRLLRKQIPQIENRIVSLPVCVMMA